MIYGSTESASYELVVGSPARREGRVTLKTAATSFWRHYRNEEFLSNCFQVQIEWHSPLFRSKDVGRPTKVEGKGGEVQLLPNM